MRIQYKPQVHLMQFSRQQNEIKIGFYLPVKKDSLLIAGNGWLPDVSNISSW